MRAIDRFFLILFALAIVWACAGAFLLLRKII